MSEVVDLVPMDHSAALAFMPVMQIQQAQQRYNAVLAFTKSIMNEGKDYGIVPGTEKPTLLKPGAEKLCSFFGLTPRFEAITAIEDWTGEKSGGEPLFYYRYRCQLWRGSWLIAESEGSCNSRESKYRYRWVPESQVPDYLNKDALIVKDGTRKATEFKFSYEQRETGGKYGKPEEYWQKFDEAIQNKTVKLIKKTSSKGNDLDAYQITFGERLYRVPNPDIADQLNTVQKMAQKRALIAVTLIACNASEYYTQDLEDMEGLDFAFNDAPRGAAPQNKPPADPAELKALLDRSTKNLKDGLKCIKELGDDIQEVTGNDEGFQKIMSRHHIASKADATKLDTKRCNEIIRDLYDFLQASKELAERGGELTEEPEGENPSVGGDLS